MRGVVQQQQQQRNGVALRRGRLLQMLSARSRCSAHTSRDISTILISELQAERTSKQQQVCSEVGQGHNRILHVLSSHLRLACAPTSVQGSISSLAACVGVKSSAHCGVLEQERNHAGCAGHLQQCLVTHLRLCSAVQQRKAGSGEVLAACRHLHAGPPMSDCHKAALAPA